MYRKLLTALLSLSLIGTAQATGEIAAKPSAKTKAKPVAKRRVEPPERPAPAPRAGEQEGDRTARTVFQVLLGELALQRGEVELALGSYTDLARATRDPRVVERAAEIAGLARQFELAYELAQTWIELEPDSQRARQTLTTLLVVLNRTDELAPQIGILLEQDKGNLADNLLRLNRMLARHGDRKAVQRLIDQVASPYQELPEAHFAMATAAATADDRPRAEEEVGKALKLRPDWEMAALLRAQIQIRQSPTDAIAGLTAFVDRNPDAKDARLALARMLISEKRYDESRHHFERLLRDHPDSPEVIYPVAMLALQHNDTATGKAQLEKLLQSDFPDKSTVHFFLGQIEEEQKQPQAALDHYLLVTAGEQFIPARARAAQMLLLQGKFDDARRLIHETSSRTAGERTQLTLAEAQLLREAKRFGEAYKLLEGALAKDADNLDLLYEAALMAERIDRLDALESHLKRLLEIKPDHAQGLNALGYSWADRNLRLEEAHALISRALALTPDDPFIMDSLGWVLFRQGKPEEALKTLKRAHALKPDPEIAAHLGEVLWSLDRKDEARRVLQEAARKNPDSEVLTAAVRKFLP